MTSAPDLNKKVTMTYHMLVSLLVASFSLGGIWFSINELHGRVDEMEKHHSEDIDGIKQHIDEIVNYLNEEDDGVRSDFEKEDANINEDIDYLLKKIEKLEER